MSQFDLVTSASTKLPAPITPSIHLTIEIRNNRQPYGKCQSFQNVAESPQREGGATEAILEGSVSTNLNLASPPVPPAVATLAPAASMACAGSGDERRPLLVRYVGCKRGCVILPIHIVGVDMSQIYRVYAGARPAPTPKEAFPVQRHTCIHVHAVYLHLAGRNAICICIYMYIWDVSCRKGGQ